MGQTLSIHDQLKDWKSRSAAPYLGSILMVNKNVPLFETTYGQLDRDWVLKATESRHCVEIEPSVIRYEHGGNLSLDPTYRKRDFYIGLLDLDPNTEAMKRFFSTRARYHYHVGEVKMARFYFIRGAISLKTILYFITSYFEPARRFIVRKFRVFG